MKRTNKELLDFFGLKVGDKIKVGKEEHTISIICDVVVLKLNTIDWSYISMDNLMNQDYEIVKQKPTLTEDEKIILRNLQRECEWIARDENDCVYVYFVKPIKSPHDFWNFMGGGFNFSAFNHLFQFIKWEDEEPYNIKELLDENSKRNV